MNEYITIVFTNGSTLTRRLKDLYSLSRFIDRIETMTPSGWETIVNWGNVVYVREAENHEINSCNLYDTIEKKEERASGN